MRGFRIGDIIRVKGGRYSDRYGQIDRIDDGEALVMIRGKHSLDVEELENLDLVWPAEEIYVGN